MDIKLIGQSNYTNIYGLYNNDKCIGTKEVTLAGRHVGIRFGSWSSATRAEVRKLFSITEK